jgi:hypothetical protein
MSPTTRYQFCFAYINLCGIEDEGYMCVPAKQKLRDGISNLLDGFGIQCILSQKGLLLNPESYKALQQEPTCTKNVRFERIEKIEHVQSSHKYVYDLTVEDTKNMTVLNGIACRDTFHFAGIGSKNVTLGIPRLQEILGCSKHPKTPLTTVKDKKALAMKYTCISDLRRPSRPDDHLGNYWDFPDKGVSKETAEKTWGSPTRLVLEADYDIVDMFEYVAYNKIGNRLIVDAYGELPVSRGVPGAEWCKWVDDHVETTLQDFSEIMKVCDNINSLYTNDICKMGKIYGIECARQCLMIEIRKILDHYGIYINVRHLLLLIDTMTFRGYLTPLSRHGLKKSKASALKRCTFEEVVTVLHEAALKEEVDRVDEVSACILTGKCAKLGANTVTVLKDHVMEKKYQVERPKEDEGADMWIPIQTMPWNAMHANIPSINIPNKKAKSVSPKYQPSLSPKYRP